MYDDYDYERDERMNAIYGDRGNSRRRSGKGKKVLTALAIIALAALVSVASCAAYLSAIGYGPGKAHNYTVNQVKTEAPATSVANANAEEMTTPQVIQNVLPSVVGVNVETMMGAGSGSGIIFSDDGYIVTNQHVIDGAMSVKVKLSDATEYDATIVGQDARTDLAVLKINAQNLPAATIGDSDQLVQGEGVLVIGNPLGETLSGSTTQGIISALGREIEIDGKIMHYIQTDAAINPGNSGGALVNAYGQVIGVNTSKIAATYYEAMCFAVPSSVAKTVADDLVQYGYVQGRVKLGISCQVIPSTYESRGLPAGLQIVEVSSESNLNGKVQAYDIITHCDGKRVKTLSQLQDIMFEKKPGDTITLTLTRPATPSQKAKEYKVSVRLLEDRGSAE